MREMVGYSPLRRAARMRMLARLIVPFPLLLSQAACGHSSGAKTTMPNTSDAALKAGVAQIAQRYPDFDPARKTPTVVDKGASWEVTYTLPSDMLGGAPVVVLSKKDLSVEKTYRTQ
jgi:hypothetical protein